MNLKKTLYTVAASTALIAPTFITGVVANADVKPDQPQTAQRHQKNGAQSTHQNNNQLSVAPRQTGSSATSANDGYNTTVTATGLLNKLSYKVNTSADSGADSDNLFSIRIYKDGTLLKTISSDGGTLSGSMWVGSGTYTIKVYTTNGASHWTGGLTLGGLI